MPPVGLEYFITITLPPRYYRKKAIKQLPIMKAALTEYCDNFFDSLHGCFELSKKCNIHFHGIGVFRHQATESRDICKMKFIDTAKTYSMVDVQLPKDVAKVTDYIKKDVNVTSIILSLPERHIYFDYCRQDKESKFKTPSPPELCAKCLFNRIVLGN